MRITDTNGTTLIRDEIDFSKGRLLQGADPETLVFTTWTEQPDVDAQGNAIPHEDVPTEDGRITALEDAVAAMALM